MTKDEYSRFLEAMYKEYIASRIQKDKINSEEFVRNMKRVQQTAQRLAQLEKHAEQRGDAQFADKSAFLELLLDVSKSVDYSREFFERSGVFDMLDRHLDVLAENAHLMDSPQFEKELLKSLGSTDPSGELASSLRALKQHTQQARSDKEKDVHLLLDEVKRELVKVREDVKNLPVPAAQAPVPAKRRPWIEGSGKIIRGVGAAGFDLAAGYGVLPALGFIGIPAGGLIVLSVLNGVGLIVEGAGKIAQR